MPRPARATVSACLVISAALLIVPWGRCGGICKEVRAEAGRFVPERIEVLDGDTVRWVWAGGRHTVTSGEPGSCTPDRLFDATLDVTHPTFAFPFAGMVGTIRYYCAGHCGSMHGAVVIRPRIGDPGFEPLDAPDPSGTDLIATPNPFTARTVIWFEVEGPGRVRIDITDVRGNRVATLLNGDLGGGSYAVPWNGCSGGGEAMPTGIYIARRTGPASVRSMKLLLIRS